MVHDLLEHAPLLGPIDRTDNRSQVSFVEPLERRQKEDLFLNVGREVEQLHDLCYAGSRHPAQAGQFRVVPNRPSAHESLKPDGDRHKTGDPGNGGADTIAVGSLPVGQSASTKINRVCDFLATAHASASGPAAAWNRIET